MKSTNKMKSCFVIMPFNKTFYEVYDKHIRPLIEEQLESVECVRIDERPRIDCSIIANIKNEIKRSSFVIADISGYKPNVFYEIGFAHALRKKVILIKNKSLGRLPFDICSNFVIVYDRDTGYEGLQTALKRIIAENIKNVKVLECNHENNEDKICGKWLCTYQINEQDYDVILTITKESNNNSEYIYKGECIISIDKRYHIFQTLKYNGKLNKHSRSPEEWKDGRWVEFIGSSWTNLSKSDLGNYLLNAYAVNTNVVDNRLHVKIWDNIHEMKEIFMEKVH